MHTVILSGNLGATYSFERDIYIYENVFACNMAITLLCVVTPG